MIQSDVEAIDSAKAVVTRWRPVALVTTAQVEHFDALRTQMKTVLEAWQIAHPTAQFCDPVVSDLCVSALLDVLIELRR